MTLRAPRLLSLFLSLFLSLSLSCFFLFFSLPLALLQTLFFHHLSSLPQAVWLPEFYLQTLKSFKVASPNYFPFFFFLLEEWRTGFCWKPSWILEAFRSSSSLETASKWGRSEGCWTLLWKCSVSKGHTHTIQRYPEPKVPNFHSLHTLLFWQQCR